MLKSKVLLHTIELHIQPLQGKSVHNSTNSN